MPLRRRYYAYRATTFPGFVFPVATLFLLARDLSFTGIAAAGAAAIVVGVVGEVPTGYVADRLGRRNTLLAAALAHTLAQAGYLLVYSVPVAAAVVSVSALAESLQSGTLDAWLYDVLAARDEGDDYTAVLGRGESVRRYAGAAMMVAAGPLYAADPTYPFYAMAVVNTASVASLLFLPKAPAREREQSFSPRRAATAIRSALWTPNLRSYVVFAALTVASVRVSMEYLQPVAVDSLSVLPSDPAASVGLLYAGFTAIAGVASDRAAALRDRFGVRAVLLGAPLATACLFVAVAFAPWLVLPAFVAMRPMGAVVRTVRSRYLNDRIESVGRATVMSAASLVFSVVRFPLLLGAGVVADAFGPYVALSAVNAAFVGCAAVLWVVETPIRVGRDTGVVPAD
jgi:predicted MFS family arabinose efflux permease